MWEVGSREEEAEVGVAVAGEVGTRIGEGGVVLRACVHNNDCLFSFFFLAVVARMCVRGGGGRGSCNKKSQVSLLLKNTSTIEIYNNHNNKRHNDDAVPPCDVDKASDNNTPSKGEMRACRVPV